MVSPSPTIRMKRTTPARLGGISRERMSPSTGVVITRMGGGAVVPGRSGVAPSRANRRTRPGRASAYQSAKVPPRGSDDRRRAARQFTAELGDLQRWRAASVADRLAATERARAFANFAVVHAAVSVEADYVVAAASKWGRHVGDRDPAQAARFRLQAASLGFERLEVDKMWSKLAQICVITGRTPETLTADEYLCAREQFWAVVTATHGRAPKSLCTPLFGLDAVMFHRGQAPRPSARKPWAVRSVPEIGWDRITAAAPVIAATMRRYLDQLAVSLRASSVTCIETTLRQFAGHLITTSQAVTVAGIDRTHVEAYKTWLTGRGGYRNYTQISKTTIGMRMGHLGAFFRRIIEWDYPDTPARPPVYASDVPIKDKPLPRFLDDAASAKFMAAARQLTDQFGRLAIEMLARTGIRKGELLGLTTDAVVQIGSAYWLRIPIGKLHNDRYVPLHPQLKTMIDQWLSTRPDWQNSRLLFTDRGRPIPGTRVDHAIHTAATAAGIGHVHAHQLRHTGDPGHQPRHVPRGDLRVARAQDHDPGLRPDRRQNRRRPVLLRHREGPSPLPAAETRRPAGHRRTGTDAETPRRTPAQDARQRLLRPTRRTRLPLRNDLRILHLLRHHHRVQTHPQGPTRRRRQQRPNRPPEGLRRTPRTTR
ncbi:tyrosine-type recombinase/integrase [Nakamurella sp. GG22]